MRSRVRISCSIEHILNTFERKKTNDTVFASQHSEYKQSLQRHDRKDQCDLQKYDWFQFYATTWWIFETKNLKERNDVTTQALLDKKPWQYHVMKIAKIELLTQIYHCYQVDKDRWVDENLLELLGLFELSDKQSKQIDENLSELFRLSRQITHVYKHWTRRS